MTLDLEKLQRLCVAERERIAAPMSLEVDGTVWTFATNGHAALLVAGDLGVGPAPDDVSKVLASHLALTMKEPYRAELPLAVVRTWTDGLPQEDLDTTQFLLPEHPGRFADYAFNRLLIRRYTEPLDPTETVRLRVRFVDFGKRVGAGGQLLISGRRWRCLVNGLSGTQVGPELLPPPAIEPHP